MTRRSGPNPTLESTCRPFVLEVPLAGRSVRKFDHLIVGGAGPNAKAPFDRTKGKSVAHADEAATANQTRVQSAARDQRVLVVRIGILLAAISRYAETHDRDALAKRWYPCHG